MAGTANPGGLMFLAAAAVPSGSLSMATEAALGVSVALVVLIGALLWSREHRLRQLRERLRRTYQLGEQILGSSSAESILKRLEETLPEALRASRVQLFLRPAGAVAAVRADARAGRGGGGAGRQPAGSRAPVRRGRAGAGAASRQPGGRGRAADRAARGAGAPLPHGKAGCGGPVHFRCGERAA